MSTCQLLEWDTNFFGFKVARIVLPQLSEEYLEESVNSLQKEKIRLAYWSVDKPLPPNMERSVKVLGGHLVDERTAFHADSVGFKPSPDMSSSLVRAYDSCSSTVDIETLATQVGAYSRYSIDPNMPKGKSIELYVTWLSKSLSKEIAEEVLVICCGHEVVGLVTLGKGAMPGTGRIGLLVVHPEHRRQGHGVALVKASQAWFFDRGYSLVRVVTQGRNTPACDLYKKCGFFVSSIEYVYHFWL